MPAAPLANNLDGANGTGVTTGNSGGALGNAFTNVTAGTGVTVEYTTAQIGEGTASLRFTIASGSVISSWVEWDGLGIAGGSDVYHRFFMYVNAFNAAGTYARIAEVLTQTPGSSARLLCNNTSGLIRVANAAGTEQTGSTGTVAVPTGQWVRIEWRVRSSTTVGEVEWRLYLSPTAAAASFDDTGSATGQVLGANTGTARVGPSGTTALATSGGGQHYYDWIAVSTDGWIGPSAVPPLPILVMPQFQSGS